MVERRGSWLVVVAALSTCAGCVNAAQPVSRHAALDRVEPASAAAPLAADPPAPTREKVEKQKPPVDVAEVEVVPVPGARIGRARATVLVRTSADQVRAVLFDFPSYPAFLTNYKSAQLETKKPDGAQVVRMEIQGLGGLLRRWMRVEISAPVVTGARESFDAKLLEGNVRAFEARWILERVEAGTRLTLESYLDPKLELPAAILDAGSASGLKDSILAVKARAEESSDSGSPRSPRRDLDR